jgi:hypothetical protein
MIKETIKRIKSPTPKYFKKVRAVGITAGTIGAALLAAPIALPATIITIAGYLVCFGTVSAALAQTTKQDV